MQHATARARARTEMNRTAAINFLNSTTAWTRIASFLAAQPCLSLGAHRRPGRPLGHQSQESEASLIRYFTGLLKRMATQKCILLLARSTISFKQSRWREEQLIQLLGPRPVPQLADVAPSLPESHSDQPRQRSETSRRREWGLR